MRRLLRDIERKILEKQKELAKEIQKEGPEQVVLEYCSAVRGILNKNQGGPLDPPGLRMAMTLQEVRASIERSLKVGVDKTVGGLLGRLAGYIDRGIDAVSETLKRIPGYVESVRKIRDTLDPKKGKTAKRKKRFVRLRRKLGKSADAIEQKMAGVMERFEPGLFVGGEDVQSLQDNMDLERFFRLPKSPSTLLAIDAHHEHRRPFREEELCPYLGARPSQEETEAVERRKTMRRARSRKALPGLLEKLEQRLHATERNKEGDSSGNGSHENGGS